MGHASNLVDDLLEVNCDLGILAIPMIGRIMDELRDLVKPQLCGNGVRDELAVMAMLRFHAGDSRTCFALRPKTNSIASITFDFPLPFGPTTAEKD